MNFALMREAHTFHYPNGSKSNWEYFILLGHESLALTTLQYTELYLLSYPKNTNFVNCWPSNGLNFYG